MVFLSHPPPRKFPAVGLVTKYRPLPSDRRRSSHQLRTLIHHHPHHHHKCLAKAPRPTLSCRVDLQGFAFGPQWLTSSVPLAAVLGLAGPVPLHHHSPNLRHLTTFWALLGQRACTAQARPFLRAGLRAPGAHCTLRRRGLVAIVLVTLRVPRVKGYDPRI